MMPILATSQVLYTPNMGVMSAESAESSKEIGLPCFPLLRSENLQIYRTGSKIVQKLQNIAISVSFQSVRSVSNQPSWSKLVNFTARFQPASG